MRTFFSLLLALLLASFFVAIMYTTLQLSLSFDIEDELLRTIVQYYGLRFTFAFAFAFAFAEGGEATRLPAQVGGRKYIFYRYVPRADVLNHPSSCSSSLVFLQLARYMYEILAHNIGQYDNVRDDKKLSKIIPWSYAGPRKQRRRKSLRP